jgi:hypothetical protein
MFRQYRVSPGQEIVLIRIGWCRENEGIKDGALPHTPGFTLSGNTGIE